MSKKYASFREFKQRCFVFCKLNSYHTMNYVNTHVLCFYNTYRFIVNEYRGSSERIKLLSIGAGGAFVEAYLQNYKQFDCTVLDFPEEININEGYYHKFGFKTISADVTEAGINLGNH